MRKSGEFNRQGQLFPGKGNPFLSMRYIWLYCITIQSAHTAVFDVIIRGFFKKCRKIAFCGGIGWCSSDKG